MEEYVISNNNASGKIPVVNPQNSLDETDKKILQILQDDFPLVQKPWHEISERLSINEDELIDRLQLLLKTGVIRKIGPIFDGSRIGLNAATLVAMKVPKNKIDQVARVINEYDNVSHNYEREDEYNIWFTLSARNSEDLTKILDDIKRKTDVNEQNILNLPTVHRFKINVRFQLT